MTSTQPHLLLSPGTHVVLRSLTKGAGRSYRPGSIGVVTEAPTDATHPYAVRMVDGGLVRVKRSGLTLRKHERSEGLNTEHVLEEWDLARYVMYRAVVGSHAFGLAEEGSDRDIRGIYVPPASAQWSIYGVPEQLENDDTDEVYWELQKCMTLALKANPNVLEMLWSPIVLESRGIGAELVEQRDMFRSKLVFNTYSGYVLSQFKLLERDLRQRGSIRWKHAMHLCRLLLSGLSLLQTGAIVLDVGERRGFLLDIKHGALSWEVVEGWMLKKQRDFEEAFSVSTLPERPDYAAANRFLVDARRRMVIETLNEVE